jgi:hypothetical protein
MAFQLFVDPTAGARSAASSIMQGAGDLADSIKERREAKKKERKLFDSYVTQASALGLGEGETEKERMDDLRTNQTPESLQGMVEGTKLKIYQDMQQANIANTKARTAETNQNVDQSKDLHLGTKNYQNAQTVYLGEQTQAAKENREQKREDAPIQTEILKGKVAESGQAVKTSKSNRKMNKRRMANEDAKTAIYGMNAHVAKMNAGTAQQQAANQKQEQDRLDRQSSIDKGSLNPAFDKTSGKPIPGLYMTNDGKPIPWESDLANLSPEQSELARLKGALVTLEGMPDDQEVDVDGGNELRDLAPVGWFGGLFSAGEDEAVTVRERVRGKIAELEARRNQSGGVRRYDPSSGQLTTP